MKRHLANALSGVADYASYPAGMLLVAPFVLHKLGAAEYGLWMVATAVVSAGGIVASGFSDANTQRIAQCLPAGDLAAVRRSLRAMLAINLLLGLAAASAVWAAAPWAAARIAAGGTSSVAECVVALRVAAAVVLARALESAFVSTLRGFERYRATVAISATVRLATLACAAVLALAGHRTDSILAATALLTALGALGQLHQVRRQLGRGTLLPAFDAAAARPLLQNGFYAWLLAVGGVAFAQFDRIFLGLSLGAAAVAPYALCVQFAQPVHGVCANALHFLFPHLSRRAQEASPRALRRTVLRAAALNALMVTLGAAAILLAGPAILRVWAGAAVASSAAPLLPPIVAGSALLGLSVTGIYALQALGKFRSPAAISLGGKAAMLALMPVLLRRFGVEGVALARAGYGFIALAVYIPLVSRLRPRTAEVQPLPSSPLLYELPREAQP